MGAARAVKVQLTDLQLTLRLMMQCSALTFTLSSLGCPLSHPLAVPGLRQALLGPLVVGYLRPTVRGVDSREGGGVKSGPCGAILKG